MFITFQCHLVPFFDYFHCKIYIVIYNKKNVTVYYLVIYKDQILYSYKSILTQVDQLVVYENLQRMVLLNKSFLFFISK